MLENLLGHTWCSCLACDQALEAFQILIVLSKNRDDNLSLTFVHFPHTSDTSYVIFGETYHLLHPRGEIQDPQLVDYDEDDDDWDEDDGI